jgi:hypothetical protein
MSLTSTSFTNAAWSNATNRRSTSLVLDIVAIAIAIHE